MHLASRIAHLACPPLPPSTLGSPRITRSARPRGGGGGCSSTHPLHAAANQSPAALPVVPTNGLTSQISRIPSHPFTDPGPRRAPFWPPLVQEQPRDGVSTLKLTSCPRRQWHHTDLGVLLQTSPSHEEHAARQSIYLQTSQCQAPPEGRVEAQQILTLIVPGRVAASVHTYEL